MQSTDHFSYDEYDRLTRAYVDQRAYDKGLNEQ